MTQQKKLLPSDNINESLNAFNPIRGNLATEHYTDV